MATLVKAAVAEQVAIIRLNRPERHNSLIPALLTDLMAAFDDAETDPDVRSIVLAATGRSFSTGGDVGAFHARGDDLAEYAAETVGLLNRTMLLMLGMSKPIVAAVHGMVTGGSLGLVLASDIVLVGPDASFTPWYSVVGFSPDGGWTALLPQLIGRQRTGGLLAENGTISAAEAVEWGLARRVVATDRIAGEALRVASDIAQRRPGALASGKRLLVGDIDAVAEGLERERTAFVGQIVTEEARRGMATFLGLG